MMRQLSPSCPRTRPALAAAPTGSTPWILLILSP